ncbi:hypothetical protein ACTQ33_15115 [Candidatus Avoscillospira sp. LCP25S3_F1]|uniref:hypothetical protein n=1 Tax=Candidatus Avoscillospira sp. LCP25S3_F1 TaxID=3438825 RepID=UPI003F8DA8F2
MLHRRSACLGILLPAVLMSCLSGIAHAAVGGGDLAFPENTQPGQTAVGVQVTGANVDVLSYEVPLYVTLAVVDHGGQTEVICPDADAYYIENTSPTRPDGQETAVAVTEVTVSTVPGGTWDLVEGTPDAAGELALTIGGLALPAVEAGTGTSFTVEIAQSADSVFYADTAYVELTGSNRQLSLPIAGEAVALDAESKPAAQFKLRYTVSLLDADGDPIGVFVENPTRTQP